MPGWRRLFGWRAAVSCITFFTSFLRGYFSDGFLSGFFLGIHLRVLSGISFKGSFRNFLKGSSRYFFQVSFRLVPKGSFVNSLSFLTICSRAPLS